MFSLKYPESNSSVLLLPYAGLATPAAALHRREAEINSRRDRRTANTQKLMCFSLLFMYKRTRKKKIKNFSFLPRFSQVPGYHSEM